MNTKATCECGREYDSAFGKRYCSLRCRTRAEKRRRRERDSAYEQLDARETAPTTAMFFATLDNPTRKEFLSARDTALAAKSKLPIRILNISNELVDLFELERDLLEPQHLTYFPQTF